MRSWRGLARKMIGGEATAGSKFAHLSLKLPGLFVLKPDEGVGKDFVLSLQEIGRGIDHLADLEDAEKTSVEILELCRDFSATQRKLVETMLDEITLSADELLNKLSSYVEVQSDRISEIEKVRSNLNAAQSANTLESMKSMLSQSLEGVQLMVENELNRQKELRTDHESYAARLQIRLDTVEKESRTDALTGIANRVGCMKKMASVIDYVKTNRCDYSLVLIDLNGFKKINDTLGHAAGDAALVSFAQRLNAAFGKDSFVGRLAGDEFVIITHSPTSVIIPLLKKLQDQFVTLPAAYKGINLEISFCYGVSSFEKNSVASNILEQADIALYRHKNEFYDEKAA